MSLPSPPRVEILPPATRRVFDAISDVGGTELEAFTLVGGTAVALHLGHRLSFDLDFATESRLLPRNAIRTIIARLQGAGLPAVRHKSPAENTARDEFIDAGQDIDDFQQNFVVDGVKVTFFSPDDQVSLSASHEHRHLRVASLATLSTMKALLLQYRSSARDVVDLFCLMKAGEFSRDSAVRAYEDYRAMHNWAFAFSEARILAAGSAPDDPGYEALISMPSLHEISKELLHAVNHDESASPGPG